MAAPTTQLGFLELLRKSRLVTDAQLIDLFPDEDDRRDPKAVADGLVKAGLLTRYQVQMLTAGKHRGFFLGPYKILRPLGQGGMGAVYLAEHTSLGRQVAVKVLPPDKAKDRLALERFHREARAAAALDHPNIVRLHDISQGGGVHFLVMEYVDGTDLQSLMGQTGPLHYAQAAQYVAQAAAGLHHAHEKGFIHRDIKPANLMLLKAGGVVKILDMGLARSLSNPTDHLTANMTDGDIAGTIDYLSPEQALNMPLDERSDIYSLGATFYSLVTGHPPFKGTTAQKLMQHQLKEPPSVSLKLSGRVPQALSDVVAKMMAKKPSERFQTAADVVDALGPWLPVPTTGNIVTDSFRPGGSGQTTPIRKSSRLQLIGEELPPAGSRVGLWVAAGVGAVLLAGAGAVALAFALGGKPAEPPARPTAITPAPGTEPPPAPASVVPYSKIDFAGLPPASVRVGGVGKGGEVLKAINGQPLPAAVAINHFSGEAVGEYAIAEVNGATAISLRQMNRRDGVQVHFFADGTLSRLREGTRAVIRLTYQLDGSGEGSTCYELSAEPYTKHATTKLPPTGGRWKVVDVPFVKPPGGGGYELIVNPGNAPYADGTIAVKSVELLPADAAAVPTPASGRAVYALDLSGQKAFSRRGKSEANNDPVEDVRLVVAQSDGGDPPVGWRAATWDLNGELEFFGEEKDGRPAIGLRSLKLGEQSTAAFTGMLFSPVVRLSGTSATVRFTYRTQTANAVAAQLKFKPTVPDPRKAWVVPGAEALPGTGGKWVSRELTIDLKGATGGFFEFHPFSYEASDVFHLAAFEVLDPAAKPDPPKGGGEKAAVPLVPDLVDVRVGTYPLASALRSGAELGAWAASQFDPDSTGELTVSDDGGTKALTLVNATGTPSAQVYQTKPAGTLWAGRSYLLKFEYAAADGTSGLLEVREREVSNWKDCPLAYKLDPTAGEWEKRTFEVQVPHDYPAVFVIQNLTGGAGNRLSVRNLEIALVGGD